MTDLEAKISSEFANGDPTEGSIELVKKQPRVSVKRLVPVVAAMLIIGGGVITFFASTEEPATSTPVVETVQPAAVQATVTETSPAVDTPTATAPRVSVARAQHTTKVATPAPQTTVTPTPAVQTPTPVTPVVTEPKPNVIQNITGSVLQLVDSILSGIL